MKVPLITDVKTEAGQANLIIWKNGQRLTVPLPFNPYFYSKSKLDNNHLFIREDLEIHKSLSNLNEEEYWRYEVKTPGIIYNIKESNSDYFDPLNWGETGTSYVHRVLIDEPDFFNKFANTENIKVLHIDIEQEVKSKSFPTKDDLIIAIGVGINNQEPIVWVAKNLEQEQQILLKLRKLIQDEDPDMIVGYNHLGYDLPRLCERYWAHNIHPGFFSRDEVFSVEKVGDEWEIDFGGRILYDLYHSVLKDQTLHGIKDRKLKTVAKWFKLSNVVEISYEELGTMEEEKLIEYNKSDVRICQSLYNIYFPKLQGLAEYLGSPLNQLIPFNDGYPSTIVQGRILRKAGIISDGMNQERYPFIFNQFDDKGKKIKSFEGADVKIYKKGYFKPIYKYDFASLYPHIIWSAGIGPDNTKLVRKESKGEFKAWEKNGVRYYSIPDENNKCNFVISVEGESELANFIQELLADRLKLKKLSKKLKEEGKLVEHEAVESQQYALKVVLNSTYGINAAAFNRFGSAVVAIVILGFGREFITHISEVCEEGRIESDTDGIYVDKIYDLDFLNNRINMFTQMVLLGKPVMKIEMDDYIAGWFHEMKTYLLLEKDKKTGELKLKKHGAGFKGSNLPGIFDKIISDVGYKLLSEGPENTRKILRKYIDLSNYEPEDFYKKIKLGKNEDEYANDNALALQVALDYQKKTGFPVTQGHSYSYVKTSKGYEAYDEKSFARIDTEYYRGIVFTALERLGFKKDDIVNKKLSDFK